MTDIQIKYEQNAKDCELAKSGSCCYCKNFACYQLEEQLKAKEQKCEELNEHSVGFARKCQNLELDVFHLKDKNYNLQRQLDQAKAELELYKRSKQASYEEMQRRWSEVEQENRQLKRQHQGDKGLITSTGKMNYQLLQEYDKLKTENENWQKEYWKLEQGNDFLAENNSRLKQTLAEIKEIAEKNLDIHTCAFTGCGYELITKQILQKINEVEE